MIKNALAAGIKLRMSPGKGAFPVGQFDAQNLLPKGRIPSLASSVRSEAMNRIERHTGMTCVLTLVNAGSSKHLSMFISINEDVGVSTLAEVMTFYSNVSYRVLDVKRVNTHSYRTTSSDLGIGKVNKKSRYDRTGTQEHKTYLRATKTLSARSAAVPNTLLKSKAATVTPEDSISAYRRHPLDRSFRQIRMEIGGDRRTLDAALKYAILARI